MKHIRGLDGTRGCAALGVVAFHVAVLDGYVGYNSFFDRTIGRGDCFVRLFFMLSGFSLMCAYYKKFVDRKFDIESFLFKRCKKIFPLFWFAMILHGVINYFSGSINSVWEYIGTGSLLFGLMPSSQDSMVWAGWTMGIQMIFYLIFPIFLIMIKNKKRAWLSFIISGILLLAYKEFYGAGIENAHINILRQGIFFVCGGVIFHYKEDLENLAGKKKIFIGLLCLGMELLSFFLFGHVGEDTAMLMAFSAFIVLQIIGVDYCMNNSIAVFLGGISFEIYLVHTIVWRLCSVQGLKIWIMQHITTRPMYGFLCEYIIILIITIILSFLLQKVLIYVERKALVMCCIGNNGRK